MKLFGTILQVITIILVLLNGIIFLGGVIDLLQQYLGFFAYFLCWFVAPILSPAILFLPWFDAWVVGGSVNDGVLLLWGVGIVCIILRLITWKWAPEND